MQGAALDTKPQVINRLCPTNLSTAAVLEKSCWQSIFTLNQLSLGAINSKHPATLSVCLFWWQLVIPSADGGGGLLTLIKDLSFEEIDTSSTTHTELQAFKIHLPNQRPLTNVNTYHPPQKPGPELDLVAPLLDPNILILGDFNSKHQSWGCSLNNTEGSILSTFIDDNNLTIVSHGPTYISHSYGTPQTLDITITSPSMQQFIKNSTLKSIGSDHLPLLTEISTSLPKSSQRFFWNYKKASWNSFKTLLDSLLSKIPSNSSLEDRDYNHLAAKNKLKADQIKQNKWMELCSSIDPKTSDTKLWRLLHALNQDTPSHSSSNTFKDNSGNPLTDKYSIANHFAHHYSATAKLNFNLQNKIIGRKSRLTRNLAKSKPSHNIFSKPFQEHELDEALSHLDPTKAPGPDNITGPMLKNLSSHAKLELLSIFNYSWSSSTLPKEWKHATIIPIHKPGKLENHPTNYRPISLTSIPCKIMEHMILNSNFLSKRTIQVNFNNIKSKTTRIYQGLRQGSILSPILFNIYLNDVHTFIKPPAKIALYADDIIIWVSKNNLSDAEQSLNKAMKNLQKVTQKLKLSINTSKSEISLFTINNHLRHWTPNIFLNNSKLQYSDSPRYLGVTLDPALTFKKHIDTMISKAKNRLDILKKISGLNWGANANILRTTYLALVRPILEYATPAWINASKTNLSKMDRIQASAVKIIRGLRGSCPNHIAELKSNLLPLHLRRKICFSKFITKKINPPKEHLTGKIIRNWVQNQRLKRPTPLNLAHNSNLLDIPINPKHRTSYPPHKTRNKLICFPHLPDNPHKHETQPELLKALGLQIIEENSSLFDITIYTDGSQLETGLHLSVYKSELSAIDTALKDININSPSKIIIYSDSRAAIYTLQSCFSSQEPLLQSIAKSVNRLPANSSVTVQWLPAHVGIPGNELADSLAKAGALGLPEARESTTQVDERDLLHYLTCLSYNPSYNRPDKTQNSKTFLDRTTNPASDRVLVTMAHQDRFEAVPNMEADAFAADSSMSTSAAPSVIPGVGLLLRSNRVFKPNFLNHSLKKFGLKTFFTNHLSIGQILQNPITRSNIKKRPDQQPYAIYSIGCQDCNVKYVVKAFAYFYPPSWPVPRVLGISKKKDLLDMMAVGIQHSASNFDPENWLQIARTVNLPPSLIQQKATLRKNDTPPEVMNENDKQHQCQNSGTCGED
ncbi:hypothetical protein LAZ67_2002536 [Cordylochernes scorpioides]|uniref:RNA-directed DNA polymerase from mobile element jockey n=1 Tax=Cordylochernes scorpioides TaxID=51811 RepID=A0ABY6K5J7_9ARAC|nr:hypothetical protein LAZ67_2002536 [Cordylochernes scorpioides]